MVKKNDKYIWANGNIPKIDYHSQVKHKILNEYISAYIPILLSNPNIPKLTINLIDGFCGGGIYIDEENNLVDGSPIHLIETVNKARVEINVKREKPREIHAFYYFLDSDLEAINSLKRIVNLRFKDNHYYLNDFNRTKINRSDFCKALPFILNDIKTNKGGERSIFILDQYGYGDVKISDIFNILSNLRNPEVILTFNIDSMFPYFSIKNNFRKALINLGIDHYIDWKQLEFLAKGGYNYRAFIQRSIAKAIKELSGAKFITLFFIKPHSSSDWGYWLVHLCNEYRAHEVMKQLHWNNATFFGHELEPGIFEFGYEADRDYDRPGITPAFEFDSLSRESCINALHEDFGKLIFNHGEKIPVGKFFPHVVTNTPASEEILQTSLKQLHEEKSVEILNVDGKPRNPSKNYKKTDIIVPSRQYRLF